MERNLIAINWQTCEKVLIRETRRVLIMSSVLETFVPFLHLAICTSFIKNVINQISFVYVVHVLERFIKNVINQVSFVYVVHVLEISHTVSYS